MLTYEQFQNIVLEFIPHANEEGYFLNHDGLEGDRVYYTWQHQHFGCVSYDTNDSPPWVCINKAGASAYGASLREAAAAAKLAYSQFLRDLVI